MESENGTNIHVANMNTTYNDDHYAKLMPSEEFHEVLAHEESFLKQKLAD